MRKPKELDRDMLSGVTSHYSAYEEFNADKTKANFNILVKEHNNLVEVVNTLIEYLNMTNPDITLHFKEE